MIQRPETRYARGGDVLVAYRVTGELQGVPDRWRVYRAAAWVER